MEAAERETTITMSDDSKVVTIWSAQRKVISALRKKPAVRELRAEVILGTECVLFEVAADQWSPATGVKRHMSAQAAEAGARRLAATRPGSTTTSKDSGFGSKVPSGDSEYHHG